MDTLIEEEEESCLVITQTPMIPILHDSNPLVSETHANIPVSTVISDILNTFPSSKNIVDPPRSGDLVTEKLSVSDIPINSCNKEDKIMECYKIGSKTKIVLNYEDDQWSPFNTNGKRKYSRQFLLSLQSHPMCLCKPQTLQNITAKNNLAVIKDKAHIQRLPMHREENSVLLLDECSKKKKTKNKQKNILLTQDNPSVSTLLSDTSSIFLTPENVVDIPKMEDLVTIKGTLFNSINVGSKIMESDRLYNESKIILNYKEDQWSPFNKEGKKKYDREFLLKLQFHPMCLCKPKTLPKLNPKLNAPSQKSKKKQTKASKLQSEIRLFSPIKGDIGLHEADNAWLPSCKTEDSAEQNTEKLYKKVLGILNQLRPKTFYLIVNQMKKLDIDTEEKLSGVIDVIIEKFIEEPIIRELYAKLCMCLALLSVPSECQEGQVEFKQLLITKWQIELEQRSSNKLQNEERTKDFDSVHVEKDKESQMEFEAEDKKMLRRISGYAMLNSKLFKLNLFSEDVMHECIKKFISQGDEESLECLCYVLKVIGKELDEKGKKNLDNSCTLMDEYFAQMKSIIFRMSSNSRICLMLQDVINLRENNWVSKIEENDPQTCDLSIPILAGEENTFIPPSIQINQQGNNKKQKEGKHDVLLKNINIQLHESKNPWPPSYKMKASAESLQLYRKVRSILNNLTVKNFEILAKKAKNLVINTEEKLNGVTDVVIEQFNKEAMFRELYAKLCKYLASISVPLNGTPGQVEFGQLLIIKCLRGLKQEKNNKLQTVQRINAIGAVDLEIAKLLQMQFEEEERKIQCRKLGNIMFMSELFKLNMFTEPVMHECIKQLLFPGDEESLDCLCCMLKKIGKELDKKGKENPEDSGTLMDEHFARIQNIIIRKLASSRICFKLQDVIDIRQNNWGFKTEDNDP